MIKLPSADELANWIMLEAARQLEKEREGIHVTRFKEGRPLIVFSGELDVVLLSTNLLEWMEARNEKGPAARSDEA